MKTLQMSQFRSHYHHYYYYYYYHYYHYYYYYCYDDNFKIEMVLHCANYCKLSCLTPRKFTNFTMFSAYTQILFSCKEKHQSFMLILNEFVYFSIPPLSLGIKLKNQNGSNTGSIKLSLCI